ncbi:MAG TPA: sigma-70 family RNA polymerase sigma factor [Caldithrix sp.]|nr:sigma-70 family RNA polymerase sigma factor [Caldithrix sp.]
MLKLNFFSDREIIKRIQTNDRTVLGELFTRYQRLVFSYIQNHGGSQEDAEDMLQEAIIVLWQKVNSGTFQLSARLSTFILAVAKNKWMAQMRKRKRLSGENLPENTANGNLSSLKVALDKEQIEIVREALEQIQPVCKKILLLFYFEERSLSDITRILNFANADVVKSKKYQCKKSLEMILREKFPEMGRN